LRFQCDIRRITGRSEHLRFTQALSGHPKIRPRIDFVHTKHHYYASHAAINPTRIVPVGPLLDFESPHGRDALQV
jgi:putative glutathione S-transferase